MISAGILRAHYKEYASQPDVWVSNMEKTKRSIVGKVLNVARGRNFEEPFRVAILGASDRRYIPIHERIFSDLLKRRIELKTLDIDTIHLGGGSDVIKHDVTKPFPKAPYAVIFSHELMKFLTADEQLMCVMNSHDALDVGGIGMHIIHEPSIEGTSELRPWQNRVDPDNLLQALLDEHILANKLVFES